MADYRIITDSCCDLTAAMVEELNLRVLPLSFTMNGKTYKNYSDGREMDNATFYGHIKNGAMPTTSQVNPDEWESAFDEILANGEDLLALVFSSGLSGTYQSACIARETMAEKYPDRKIVVIDTLCAALGQGLLVYLTAQKKADGASIEEAAAYAESLIPQLDHWIAVDDLFHLKRGGRVSAASAVMGTMLSIKPIIHVDNAGKLIPVHKIRGRRQSLDYLVKKASELAVNPEEQTMFICNSHCLEDAEYVKQQLKKTLHPKKVIIGDIGPVIASHTGLGTLAVFFLGKER